MTTYDPVDGKHEGSALVGNCKGGVALTMRAALVASEVRAKWTGYAADCPQLVEAVNEVEAALNKLKTVLSQEVKP
jgi:hypothetical protein